MKGHHPMTPNRPGRAIAPDLVTASLLTSPTGAELHLVARDGQLLRFATDEGTARTLALALWQALDGRGASRVA
jgi:hypothetical protein